MVLSWPGSAFLPAVQLRSQRLATLNDHAVQTCNRHRSPSQINILDEAEPTVESNVVFVLEQMKGFHLAKGLEYLQHLTFL